MKLIALANASAVSFYLPLIDEFPKLTLISDSGLLNDFDTIISTASIGIVMTQVASSFKPNEAQKYMYAINKEIQNWNTDSSKLIIQFGHYINNLASENKINNLNELSEAVGAWIFIELYDNNPHNVELEELTNSRELFFAVGTLITNTFSNYWNK